MSRARASAILAAALSLGTLCSPAGAQEPSRGSWLIDASACGGDYTLGGCVAGRYRLPPGLTLGLEADPVGELNLDPVEGLRGGGTFYLSVYSTYGWDFRLGRSFSLGASFLLGFEAAYLYERVVDPAHGIDQSYSTTDYMLDSALKFGLSWFPWKRVGLSVTALVSLYDLRKSLVGIGISLR